MAKANVDSEIRACVDAFVVELSVLIKKATLESVLEAISGSLSAPKKRGPGRPRKAAAKAAPARRKKRKKRGRRSSTAVGETSDSVLSFIKANANCTVGEIGAAVGATTKDLRLPLQKLLADGKIKTTGQKRGTRYHAGGGRGKAKKRATKKTVTRKTVTRKKATRKKATRKKATRKKKR